MCIYAQGPDLIQVFGPPYSSPAFFQVIIDRELPIETHSTREPGTAIWTHQIFIDGQAIGEIVDFVDANLPCLVRSIHTSAPLRFQLDLSAPARLIENRASSNQQDGGGWLLEAPAGTFLYHNYPFPTPIFHQLAWHGAIQAEVRANGGEFVCGPGEALFWFAGGPDYANAILNAESAQQTLYSKPASI
jgi:hypothetical protein